ncbi:hypothetical protein ScPMuIL_007985 [Solemya velum]
MGGLTLPCLSTVALLTGLLSSIMSPVSACRCLPLTKPQQFCDSSFAVKAKVITVTPPPLGISDQLFKTKIKIMKVFKSDSDLHPGNTLFLTSPSSSISSCGVTLTENTIYFLTGKSNPPSSIDLCDWISEWSSMTKKEKKGVSGRYQC